MWSDALPNFLIGLREGLEAGLIVSILVSAVVRGERRDRLGQLWAGAASAAGLSLAFGAILTFAAADLPTTAQEAIGGVFSLVAVGFVTWMVFWMRRTARTVSRDLRARTEAALAIGGSVLFVTAFLAVAREGLETALFLWSTTRTAREATGPLLGAVIGLLAAVVLCWALYRQALRINLSRFFTWTGAALIVIAAGVLGHGLRELQEANLLPGITTYAFDLGSVIDPSGWVARVAEGVLNLSPTMTVLQVGGYLAYLVPVGAAFVVASRRIRAVPITEASVAAPAGETPPGSSSVGPALVPAAGGRRRSLLVASTVALLALGTVAAIAAVGLKPNDGTLRVSVTEDACAPNWPAPAVGQRTFEIRNTTSEVVEVYLMAANRTTTYDEVEGLAPGTSRTLSIGLAAGSYVWRCVATEGYETFSSAQQATGTGSVVAAGYKPVSAAELEASTQQYRVAVAAMLDTLARDTDALLAAVRQGGASPEAKGLWLQAHLDYIRLGAAYGTFGEFDAAINGRPNGLPDGVNDTGFTGFLRLERELWQAPAGADPAATAMQLDADVHGLVAAFPTQATDPRDLPLRAHEILENGLQFELTGITDQGSHTSLATLRADVDATRAVLDAIRAPLASRSSQLFAQVTAELDQLAARLDTFHSADGVWTPLAGLTSAQRQAVNALVSQLVEDLAPIPEILELPLNID